MFNLSMNAQAAAVEEISGCKLMSGFHCWQSLGGVTGALLMSFFMAIGLSICTSVLIMAGSMTILFVNRFRYLLPKQFDLSVPLFQGNRAPKAKIIVLGIFCFILFLTEGAMLDWSALLLQESHGYSLTYAGIGFALFSVMMTVGRFLGDWLITQIGEIRLVAAGSFLCGLGLLFTVYLHGMYIELLGFMLVGLGASNIVPILFGRGIRLAGSAGLTMVTTMGYTGVILGPALIGLLAEYTSLTLSISMIASLLFAVSYFSSAISFKKRARPGIGIYANASSIG
jgi:hypothetical protein